MNKTLKTVLLILGGLLFVALEIHLFNTQGPKAWLPWTLFLIPFAIGLYSTGAIQGLFPSKSVEEVKPVNPVEPNPLEPTVQSLLQGNSSTSSHSIEEVLPKETFTIGSDPYQSTNQHEV